jgi:RHS repeat-associated protein
VGVLEKTSSLLYNGDDEAALRRFVEGLNGEASEARGSREAKAETRTMKRTTRLLTMLPLMLFLQTSYAYDELERLSTADEKGSGVLVKGVKAGWVESDYDRQGELAFGSDDAELTLDKGATSVGAYLGSERSVTTIELLPTNSGHRVLARAIEAYVLTSDGYKRVTHARTSVGTDGRITIAFGKSEDTDHVKVHCLYDERDEQDQALDYASFKNRADSLMRVSWKSVRRVEAYRYDEKGNRLGVSTTSTDGDSSTTTELGATYYPRTDRVKTYGDWAYVYDGNGNLLEKGNSYSLNGEGTVIFDTDSGRYIRYGYDLWNRLTSVSKGDAGTESATLSASYLYDADNLRVAKTSSAGTTRWLYDATGTMLTEQAPGYTRDYVWAEGLIIGYRETRDFNGDAIAETKSFFCATDQVGSVVAVTDEAGALASQQDYSAFGEDAGSLGTMAAPYLYAGKDWDPDAELCYMWNRWYDPGLARFTTEDPAKDENNWYAYVSNRPLTSTDPTGLKQAVGANNGDGDNWQEQMTDKVVGYENRLERSGYSKSDTQNQVVRRTTILMKAKSGAEVSDATADVLAYIMTDDISYMNTKIGDYGIGGAYADDAINLWGSSDPKAAAREMSLMLGVGATAAYYSSLPAYRLTNAVFDYLMPPKTNDAVVAENSGGSDGISKRLQYMGRTPCVFRSKLPPISELYCHSFRK